MIGAGGMPLEMLEKEIARARELTGRNFGVNVPLQRPDAADLIAVAADNGVPVLSTSAGNPDLFTSMAREQGMKVIHVVSNVRMAEKAQEAGVDVIVAEGYEAGGHNGFDEITTTALVPQVADAVKTPVVAAGGIADARGMVAAFALGAEGVQMGTRFLASLESPAHNRYKELVVNAGDRGTVVTGRAFGPVRVIKNSLAERILQAESEGWSTDQILEMIGPGRTMKAATEGDLEEGSFMCGQICGMIGELKSAAGIIGEMMEAYEKVAAALP